MKQVSYCDVLFFDWLRRVLFFEIFEGNCQNDVAKRFREGATLGFEQLNRMNPESKLQRQSFPNA